MTTGSVTCYRAMMPDKLIDWTTRLTADVLSRAEAEDTTAPEAFTLWAMQTLETAGITDGTYYAHYAARGAQIDGKGMNAELGTLDLFVTHFDPAGDAPALTRRTVDSLTARVIGFIRRCWEGLADTVDDTTELFTMCQDMVDALHDHPRIRIFVLSNLATRSPTGPLEPTLREFDDTPVDIHIWDAHRFFRVDQADVATEPVTAHFDPPIPCVVTTTGAHPVMLSFIPGATLADLYAQHGAQLLELNVRGFLQSRGQVNKGIRETILTHPDRFLTYNNGITVTATSTQHPGGDPTQGISALHGLQVVNGGQTTASLYHAARNDNADLRGILVQAKINIIPPEDIAQVVPDISRFSNTQNKVTTVDLRANDPFHTAVQRVTRRLYSPSTDASRQQTIWYYERARGQYTDDQARETTAARRRQFLILHPKDQRFTPTDLAKYENTWAQLPHLVSRGAEKNFRDLMERLSISTRDGAQELVTPDWCRQMLAKAILFRATMRIVTNHPAQFAGYRANIVTYTLAKLSHTTSGELDLMQVWNEQAPPSAVVDALNDLAPRVHNKLVSPPVAGRNIGEWCKSAECWDQVQRMRWHPPQPLKTAVPLA